MFQRGEAQRMEAWLKLSDMLSIATKRNILIVSLGLFTILVSVEVLNLQKPHVPGLVANRSDPASGPAAASERARTEPAPTGSSREVAPPSVASASVTNTDIDYLASRNLLIPLQGITASQLHDTFNESRSEGRQHNALDVKAPQGTAVLATTDGAVIKLFQSDKGGITLYQLDPSGRYVYYYAHLMRYEDGIAEGKQLRRGDVIAYVGDTGNAGTGNYHLHFAISKLTSTAKWSGGDPINPYPLLVKQ